MGLLLVLGTPVSWGGSDIQLGHFPEATPPHIPPASQESSSMSCQQDTPPYPRGFSF